ncbi:ribosome biogenesis factor YjgA [Pseudodesulfovibrio sp.]|uniref:ribosome biogenesis factor YjgA n=1 Tax=unclassified Pseudodesulfovibrio TaxID=2661612 RepID=UPI003B00F1B7
MAKKRNTTLYRPEEFDEREDRPSKSQMKRDMTALQKLGEDLAALGETAVREAELTPETVEALLLIKKLTKHEARRRHLQYVGKLMRGCDTTRAREIVEEASRGRSVRDAEFHRLERLRERLVNGDDDLLQTLFDTNPEQGQRLRQFTLGARREKAAGKPSKDGRALFRLLRDLSFPEEN